MNNTMIYKGYVGSIEYTQEDGVLFGKVQGIRSLLSYEGSTIKKLVNDFHSVVDDYLADCEEEGVRPEKAYKGSFNVRVRPEIHQKAAIYSINHGESLNGFVEEAIEEKLARTR